MKRPDPDSDITALEDVFAVARAAPPRPSDTLQQRVLADAYGLQPSVGPTAGTAPFWAALWRTLGGAPGLGGLATAAGIGVWLGIAPPAAVPDLAGEIFATEAALANSTGDDILAEFDIFGWDNGSDEG
tara:strand:- start:10692 stop:11078 length:387 start_codon:yes stop_codon:yes gene_type:complete